MMVMIMVELSDLTNLCLGNVGGKALEAGRMKAGQGPNGLLHPLSTHAALGDGVHLDTEMKKFYL